MIEKAVLYVKKDHVATITLNRPAAGNAINWQLGWEMEEVCKGINQDNDVYAVVITGAGKAFCSGSDLETQAALPSARAKANVAASVAGIDRPVVAAINGDALGEGLELALACDIRLASDKASFGLPQIASGAIPTNGGTQRLPRIVGKGKAMEMILTGKTIGAEEAYEIGLVSKIVPEANLAAETEAIASKIATQAPISLRFTKEAVNKGLDVTLEQGLRLEADLYLLLHTTTDRTEGIKAFLEKRKAEFKGR